MQYKSEKSKKIHAIRTEVIWFMPSVILAVVVTVLAIVYVTNCKQYKREEVYNRVEEVTKEYQSHLEYQLFLLAAQASPEAAFFGENTRNNLATVLKLLTALTESSNAYQTAYVRADGIWVNDQGETSTLDSTIYQQLKENGATSVCILHTDVEKLPGKSSIVVSVPIISNGKNEGYVFSYYPTDQFEQLVGNTEFSKKVFYALVDNAGMVLSVNGYSTQLLEVGLKIDEGLEQAEFSKGTINGLMEILNQSEFGSFSLRLGEEDKYLCIAPLDNTGMHILMGVDNSYLDKQINQLMKPVYILFSVLAVGLITYIISMTLLVQRWNSDKLLAEEQKDELTGLDTRLQAISKMEQYIENNQEGLGALLIINVNNFKEINQQKGMKFADEVLRVLGKRLSTQFREKDIVSHFGGDTFAVFLVDFPDMDTMKREADRVCKVFRHLSMEQVDFTVNCSIGGAMYPDDCQTVDELMKCANEALEIAKYMGEDQKVFYEEMKTDEEF